MTESSSSSAAIPPALAFLVSNFHSLVNIKLDSGNYLLWKTQVMNAFRANGYIGFLDGTIQCPSSTTQDSSHNTVVNPEYTKWMLINNQLLSCLTASLSSTTLPHVLGLEYVSQVWFSLAQRFNSLSRSRIHDLKSRLYSVTKTGTMDSYIDEIRSHAQRLEAVGHHIDDDDLVFYTLNGLPKEEFKQLRTAIAARGGDITFEELTIILRSEETRTHKDELNLAKVFVVTSKLPEMTKPQPFNPSSSSGPSMFSDNSGGSSSQVQMFQPFNGPGPFYPQSFPKPNRNNTYDGGFNRNRGGRGFGFGGNQRPECQICGKNNHTAMYCYYRQNMQFQHPSFMPGRFGSLPWFGNQGSYSGFTPSSFTPPMQNSVMGYNGASGSFYGQNGGSSSFPGQNGGFSGSNGQNGGFSGFHGQNGGFSRQYPGSTSSQYPRTSYPPPVANMVSHGGNQGVQHASSSLSSMDSSAITPNWYFDSGASAHVTNDLANLQIHQPCHAGEGVVVGNGNSIPVSYSGQSHTPSSSQGTMSSGFIPNSDLL